MFFGFWQFKITVSLLLLTSCLGQELLRTCDRDYCYDRSVEWRNIKADRLREWYRDDRLHDDMEHENRIRQEQTANRQNGFREFHEDPVDISDYETRRLNSPRESNVISREVGKSPRIRNNHRVMIDNSNAMADRRASSTVNNRVKHRDIDRHLDDTRRTEGLSERILEETQYSVANERKSLTDTTLRNSNERKHQQVENRESPRYNDRLSETRDDLEQRNRREINNVHRESHRLTELIANENTKQLRDTFEQRSTRGENLHRLQVKSQRSNSNEHRSPPNQRVSENERRLEFPDRGEYRVLSLRELNTLDMYERQFNKLEYLTENRGIERSHEFRRSLERVSKGERLPEERKTQRFGEHLSQRNLEQEFVTRIENENQRDISRISENESHFESRQHPLRELQSLDGYERRLNERKYLTENSRSMDSLETGRLAEERKSLKQLAERKNQRSSERVYERDLEKESVIRIGADKQNNIQHFNKRVSENERRFESRQLPLRELNALNRFERRLNERDEFNENRNHVKSTSEERNVQDHNHNLQRDYESRRSIQRKDLRQLTERENQRPRDNESNRLISRRDIKRESSNLIERRDRVVQIRETSDRRESLTQLDTRDNRYDMNKYERESRNILKYTDNRVQPAKNELETKQRELNNRREVVDQNDVSSRLNDRLERRFENLESRHFNGRQMNIEEEKLQSRQDILLRGDSRESMDGRRREDMRQFERRENKRDHNRAFNENEEFSRLVERNFENNEKVHRRLQQDINELSRNRQSNERSFEIKKKENNELAKQRINLIQQDYHYKADKYIEKPSVFFNRSFMAVGQGALLAYVIMKTLNNGKNDIKYNIYQKLQAAIAVMGF